MLKIKFQFESKFRIIKLVSNYFRFIFKFKLNFLACALLTNYGFHLSIYIEINIWQNTTFSIMNLDFYLSKLTMCIRIGAYIKLLALNINAFKKNSRTSRDMLYIGCIIFFDFVIKISIFLSYRRQLST